MAKAKKKTVTGADALSDTTTKVKEAKPDFTCGENGKVQITQNNIRVAMAALGVVLKYNQFERRATISWPGEEEKHIDDIEMTRLWLSIDEKFKFRPTKEFFWDVANNEAQRNRFHPVLKYFDSLKWDGHKRIGSWLSTYGGAEVNNYTRAVGELVLVAAVRRIKQPGCKFDELLILEGAQGTNKSSAVKLLAKYPEWFTDSVPLGADDKVVIEQTLGKFIVEIAELQGMRRADIPKIKNFMTKASDRARLAYGRLTNEIRRSFIAIATINETVAYLRDETGNRRFWPVSVKGFDLRKLGADVDQLWAEAVAREASWRGDVRLDKRLWAVAGEQQSERTIDDPWFEVLEAEFGDKQGKIATGHVWAKVGKGDVGSRTHEDERRLGTIMQKLGFERRKARVDGKPKWCYMRGTVAEREKDLAF